jgi:hypothetical protein
MAKQKTPAPPLPIWRQVERLVTQRTYLRSGIASLIAIAKDVPGAIKPSILDQLQLMLDNTAIEGEDDG